METCDHPIKLGSILFTLVEPTRGHEVAYNRWYERDHLYAGVMIGPYGFSAGRFVATKDLKSLRYPADSTVAPSGKGSFLAMYWILDGHHDDWWRWGRKQVKVLIDNDRMFTQREHVHTQLYRYAGGVFRDPDGVPAELALDHRFPGIVVVAGKTTGDRDDALARLGRDVIPGVLSGSQAAMCLTFVPFPMPPGQPSDVPASADDEQRFLQVWFCEANPVQLWDATFRSLPTDFDGAAEVLLAAPFVATVPGTDTYTDQLW